MKLNEFFQIDFARLSEALDRDDAIRKIKKLQNTAGRSDNEVGIINNIITKLSKEFNITPQEIGQREPVDPIKAKMAKAAYEKQMAANAFKNEWSRIKRSWFAESIEPEEFRQILEKFLPFAQKIIKLDKLPTIILRKVLDDDHQPTHGRFYNEQYVLEIAIANRQPVDILRTVAHELVHAKQQREGVNIDPTTGSVEENEANAVAGIIMRHFNKAYPEYLSYQPVAEGTNNGRKRICR